MLSLRVMFLSLLSQFFSSVRSVSEPLSIQLSPYCLAKSQSSQTGKPPVPPKDGSGCGEDDFVIKRDSPKTFFGVADGVGGWNRQGINPKIFTSELMTLIRSQFSLNPTQSITQTVSKAFSQLQQTKPNIRHGSCTLCLVSFDSIQHTCSTYNLGDSGYCVCRNGKIIYKSIEQQRSFNAPYQIGLSDGLPADLPTEGIEKTFTLLPNDVVIVGTDGLFDNLFTKDILKIVNSIQKNKSIKGEDKSHTIAKELVIAAKRIGESKDAASPFSTNAAKAGYYFVGGKNDDTTVVVGIVQSGSNVNDSGKEREKVCDSCQKDEL